MCCKVKPERGPVITPMLAMRDISNCFKLDFSILSVDNNCSQCDGYVRFRGYNFSNTNESSSICKYAVFLANCSTLLLISSTVAKGKRFKYTFIKTIKLQLVFCLETILKSELAFRNGAGEARQTKHKLLSWS